MGTSTPSVIPAQRYHTITHPCEYVELYRPGRYHPVNLGDVFNDGRYKIIRKLGYGSFSTVWLAHDLKDNTYVAIKILVSEISDPIPEVQMLNHIKQTGVIEAAQHFTQLLRDFKHHGPNGVHACLVFEAMGPSVNAMVEELPQFKPRKRKMKVRYPFWMAKSILEQSLEALSYLHSRGIAHGDFQPGNMLFCLDNIDTQPETALEQPEDVKSRSISPPVKRLDGEPDLSAPRYLCVPQPLATFTSYIDGFKIKLSDMGGAYFFTDPPEKIIAPFGLRPPELVLSGKVGRSLDMWSFGCLLFELVTGRPLFCVPWRGEQAVDDYLLQISALLGVLPDELFKQWKNSALYYTAERVLFNCYLGGVPEGGEPLMIEQTTMEDLFDKAKPELSEEDAQNVKALIRRILQYDPEKRPTPDDILSDPLFR